MSTTELDRADETKPHHRVRPDLLVGVGLLAVAIVGRLAWTLSESGLAALASN